MNKSVKLLQNRRRTAPDLVEALGLEGPLEAGEGVQPPAEPVPPAAGPTIPLVLPLFCLFVVVFIACFHYSIREKGIRKAREM